MGKKKDFEYYINKTIIKIPENIIDKINSEVLFVEMKSNGRIIPNVNNKKAVIILNLKGYSEEDKYRVIAHEIAHFIKGHHLGGNKTLKQREIEADAKMQQWGFEPIYKNYDSCVDEMLK